MQSNSTEDIPISAAMFAIPIRRKKRLCRSRTRILATALASTVSFLAIPFFDCSSQFRCDLKIRLRPMRMTGLHSVDRALDNFRKARMSSVSFGNNILIRDARFVTTDKLSTVAIAAYGNHSICSLCSQEASLQLLRSCCPVLTRLPNGALRGPQVRDLARFVLIRGRLGIVARPGQPVA